MTLHAVLAHKDFEFRFKNYIKEKRLPIMETYRQDKRNSPLALFVYKP